MQGGSEAGGRGEDPTTLSPVGTTPFLEGAEGRCWISGSRSHPLHSSPPPRQHKAQLQGQQGRVAKEQARRQRCGSGLLSPTSAQPPSPV